MTTNHQPGNYVNEHVASSVTLREDVGAFPGRQHPPPSPSPVPFPHGPLTEHDLDFGNDFMPPRPLPFTEPSLTVTICDHNGLHHGDNFLSACLRGNLSATPDAHGNSLHFQGPGELSSFQSDDQHDSDAINRETPSTAPGLIPICCVTLASPASKSLHYHVNSDGKMYRWGAEDGPIPISVNLNSFKLDNHGNRRGLMVQRCLETVVRKLNYLNIGLQFECVQSPSESAFFVTRGIGYTDSYASAFFPGSDPKDWYIYIYDLGLELDETRLIKVLTHEMMHVVGLRHCYVDPEKENEPYVRYPRGISNKENWDTLMQPHLTLSDLSKYDLKLRTVEDLRKIYALKTGEWVDCYEIQDVSCKVGAAYRRAIALNNACFYIPKL